MSDRRDYWHILMPPNKPAKKVNIYYLIMAASDLRSAQVNYAPLPAERAG
jgi:hypothetical protein